MYKTIEMKIVTYKTVHTGVNTQFGGDKKGFVSELYQVELNI